jgi:hypothetical protein
VSLEAEADNTVELRSWDRITRSRMNPDNPVEERRFSAASNAKKEVGLYPEGFYEDGGTYSFGLAEPSPKKNASICFTITS